MNTEGHRTSTNTVTADVLHATTSRPLLPLLHSRIGASAPIGKETVLDVASEARRLEGEFATLKDEVGARLRERLKGIAEPVRVVEGKLLVNEDNMISGLPYEVVWNEEHYRVLKTAQGHLNIVEVADE